MHQLIRASAGTGKTWRLTGHFLKQLFAGARPESILATTFTRKAAGEILGRVLLRLAEAATDASKCDELSFAMNPLEVTQERAASLLQKLTSQLHRLRVSTLDSFFQQVAHSLTMELGLSPGWSIVDDYADSSLRQRAIDSVLAEQDTRDSRQLMQMLAKGRSRRSVRSLINEAIEGYYELFLQTEYEAWDRIPRSAVLTEENRQICIVALHEVELTGKRMPKTRLADLERFESENWVAFLTMGLASAVAAGKSQFNRQDISAELCDAYQPLVRHASAEVLNQVAYRNQAAWNLIARFDTAYQQLRRDTGFTRFNEITRLLSRSGNVVEGHRVNYRLDSTLRHLLLDEFQDTSLDQWNVLQRLVRPLVQKAGDDRTSVFCVGDPKQAIYGWRGGVAEIMDEVQAAVPGIITETLDESRRSSPAVIDTVNHVFQRLHLHKNLDEYSSACYEWRQAFPKHLTFRTGLPGFAEFRTSPIFDDNSELDKKTAYTGWVAEQVRDIHQDCPGAEIGVLMRTNGGVSQLVHQLAQLGVPASEEGGTPPTDSPAVLAVMSLLYLASHPGCLASRYHVAHSPLADLANLHEWQDDSVAMASSTAIRRRLLDDGYGRTLQWITESVVERCSDRDRLRLQQVVAEAWRFDSTPSLNPAEFVQLLETCRFSRSSVAPVRVMTVHQSKGLEFEIVVAPELTGSLMMIPAAAAGGVNRAAAPEDVCVWMDKGIRRILPKRLQDAFLQTTGDGVRGSLCLLYVIMTRAIYSLHLLVPPETKTTQKTLAGILAAAFSENKLEEDNQVWCTGDASWFEHVPHTQETQPQVNSSRKQQVKSVPLAKMPDGRQRGLSRRTPSDHPTSRLPLRIRSTASTGQADAVDPRARGTLMHAWFEQIHWLDRDSRPSPEQLRLIANEPFIRDLRLSEKGLESLMTEFLKMLDLPATQAALTESAALERFAQHAGLADISRVNMQVEIERPFVYREYGHIVRGTIDRLVIAEQSGKNVAAEVIDFKTDRMFGEYDAWIAQKQNAYANQLQDYRMAVSRCFGIPSHCITTSLLLLEADSCIEVL